MAIQQLVHGALLVVVSVRQAQTGYTYAAYEALRGTGAANQYEYLLLDERRTITNSILDGGAGELDDGNGFITDGAGNQLFQDNPNGGFKCSRYSSKRL